MGGRRRLQGSGERVSGCLLRDAWIETVACSGGEERRVFEAFFMANKPFAFFDGLSGREKSFLNIGFGFGFVSGVLFATLIALIIFRVFHRRKFKKRHVRRKRREPRRRRQRLLFALDPVRGDVERSSAQEGESLQLRACLGLRGL